MKYTIAGDITFSVMVFDEEVEMQGDFFRVVDGEEVCANFDELEEEEKRQAVWDYLQEQNNYLPELLDIYIQKIELAEAKEA